MLIARSSIDENQGRRRFTLKYKRDLIAKIEGCSEFCASLEEACRKFGINSQYYRQWKKQLDHVPEHVSSNVREMHSGRHGLLGPLDDFLLRYIFELREQGMVVTT